MPKLYNLQGKPQFDHDFEHVSYQAEAFDTTIGAPGCTRCAAASSGVSADLAAAGST